MDRLRLVDGWLSGSFTSHRPTEARGKGPRLRHRVFRRLWYACVEHVCVERHRMHCAFDAVVEF